MKHFCKHLLVFAILFASGWAVVSAQTTRAIDNKCFGLMLVDNISQYTTAGELNNYDNRLRLQNINLTAEDLKTGNNVFKFYRTAQNGTKHLFAELIMNAAVAGTSVTVTPSVRYYDENNNLTANGGNTAIKYSSRTFAQGDTLDLYGVIDYVNDVFSEEVADNQHPDSYSYYATFNEEGGIISTLDFTGYSQGNYSGALPGADPAGSWTVTNNGLSAQNGSARIQANATLTFTVPATHVGKTVTIALTRNETSAGNSNRYIRINGGSNQNVSTVNTTYYFTFTAGTTITIQPRSGNTYTSPYFTQIVIYPGEVTGN